MKKYLREIQLAGMLLLLIGVVMTFTIGLRYGVWPCAAGLLLWLVNVVYKAFHWQEYARENSIVIHESYSGIGKFFDEHVREFWNIDRIDCERLSRNNKGQPWRFTKSIE